MHVTMKDIAKKLGISESTVSLALNNSPLVNKNTKKRVLRVAEEMGYSPNIIAKNLAKSKTNTLGLIIPDIQSAFYSSIISWVDKKARMHGYNVLHAVSFDSRKIERSIMESFVAQRLEGVLIVPANKYNPGISHFSTLDKYKVPYMYVTAYYEDTDDCMYSMGDLFDGEYRIASHLLDLGHRDILFLGGKRDVATTKLRVDGFDKAYRERGLTYNNDRLIHSDNIDYDAACSRTEEALSKGISFTAVMAINDEMALGCINTLLRAGIRVPEEVAVAGYDDSVFSKVSSVPITTVNQNMKKICETAVKMIIADIEGEEIQNKKVKVRQEIVLRESSGHVIAQA